MLVGIAVLLSILLKAILLVIQSIPFNSDEAIVALMASHILQGARPVFFYGQAYMGSLDAYLVAGGFAILGENVLVVRLVQTILYAGFIVVMSLTVKDAFDSEQAGIITAFLLAIPSVNMTLYTTASLGGYGEALLIGSLQAWLAVRMVKKLQSNQIGRQRYWAVQGAILGGLTGLGLWANALSLVYAAPAGLAVFTALIKEKHLKKNAALPIFLISYLAGFLAGSYPWWGFALQNGFSHLIGELGGSAVAVERSPYGLRVLQHLINFVLLGIPVILGIRPPWEIRWLAIPLAPFALALWVLSFVNFFKGHWRKNGMRWLLFAPVIVLMAGFLFTSFGVDPSGRYFLPVGAFLVVTASLFLVERVNDRRIRFGLVGLMLIFNLVGTLQAAFKNPPGITTQFYFPAQVDHQSDDELIEFLKTNQVTRGYSNYWVSYPLAFKSDEEIIFVPVLPYHPDLRYTARDNRYAPYNAIVASSDQLAYITTRNEPLNQRLRAEFTRLGSTWQEKQIGEFHVFYDLEPIIRIDEIRLNP